MLRVTLRVLQSSSVRSFTKQLEYLLANPSISPNQLKWKQLINVLIGSPRSSERLLEDVPISEVIRLSKFLSDFPNQDRRHDLFGAVVKNLAVSQLNSVDSLNLLDCALNSGLDVLDHQGRRFKSNNISDCISACHSVINSSLPALISSRFLQDDVPRVIHCVALAQSKGWLDEAVTVKNEISSLLESACLQLYKADLDFTTRCNLIWSIAQVSQLNEIPLSMDQLNIIRRGVAENELLQFRIFDNMSHHEFAERRFFYTLLQLEHAYAMLGIRETNIANTIRRYIEQISLKSLDTEIACSFIWWCAKAESDIHPHLIDWVKTCMGHLDRLPERDRWISVNGTAHILDMARKNNKAGWAGLTKQQREQLLYFISKHSS